jgi:hypothetical protein
MPQKRGFCSAKAIPTSNFAVTSALLVILATVHRICSPVMLLTIWSFCPSETAVARETSAPVAFTIKVVVVSEKGFPCSRSPHMEIGTTRKTRFVLRLQGEFISINSGRSEFPYFTTLLVSAKKCQRRNRCVFPRSHYSSEYSAHTTPKINPSNLAGFRSSSSIPGEKNLSRLPIRFARRNHLAIARASYSWGVLPSLGNAHTTKKNCVTSVWRSRNMRLPRCNRRLLFDARLTPVANPLRKHTR